MAQEYESWSGYQDPDPIRSFEDNRALLQWSIQHCTIVGNWLQLQIPSRSQGELQDLIGTIPQIGLLTTGSIASARKVLYFLCSDHRFNPDQEAELSLIISTDAALAAILVTYHVDGQNQSTYVLFKHWAHLGLM
jgi:hypothetical protein